MSSIILFRRLVMANSFARWNAAASSHSIVSQSELLRNARKGGAIDKASRCSTHYRVSGLVQSALCGAPHKAEIGAAWSKRSSGGRDYLSVKLDDPSFTAPIYANLFDDEGGETFTLIWSRGRKQNGD
jgi:uncharacterized protein (DUF736 family)